MASETPPSPTPPEALGSVPAGTLWSALASDPATGVTVLSADGRIVWGNDQAARIFFGPDAVSGSRVGRMLVDFFPAEWVEERLRLIRGLIETNRPIQIRVIWRGYQQLTWAYPIDAEGNDPDPDEYSPGPVEKQVLCITRRVTADDEAEPLTSAQHGVFESKFVDLGPLDVLSAREIEVLALIGQGLRVEEIARVLFRSVKTIGNHRDHIAQKLDAHDRVHLAEIARRAGLTLRDAERTRV